MRRIPSFHQTARRARSTSCCRSVVSLYSCQLSRAPPPMLGLVQQGCLLGHRTTPGPAHPFWAFSKARFPAGPHQLCHRAHLLTTLSKIVDDEVVDDQSDREYWEAPSQHQPEEVKIAQRWVHDGMPSIRMAPWCRVLFPRHSARFGDELFITTLSAERVLAFNPIGG